MRLSTEDVALTFYGFTPAVDLKLGRGCYFSVDEGGLVMFLRSGT